MSFYQILDKNTIIDMFCMKWNSRHIKHLTSQAFGVRLRNPFSQNNSTIVYIYILPKVTITDYLYIFVFFILYLLDCFYN